MSDVFTNGCQWCQSAPCKCGKSSVELPGSEGRTRKRFATHCDTEVRFFDTLAEAQGHAVSEICESRRESERLGDGWDEDLTESIVVLQVVNSAQKVDPDADYRCVDYHLGTVTGP